MLALAEARRQEESDKCHLCGLPRAVCRDRATEKLIEVDAERCHVATAVAREREKFTNPGKGVLPAEFAQALDFIPSIQPDQLGGLLGG